MNAKTLWKCPKCGRQFPKKHQWHSCVFYAVEEHFVGKPPSLNKAFDYLIAKIRQFGPIRIDAVKSSVNIAGKYHFATVFVLRNSLDLQFIFDRYLDHRRIFRTQKLGPAKHSHVVKLVHKQDVDAELLRWLRKAFSLRR
ncbi:MAG: DUF5655 domain-containing protein [Bacteroidota bacterium]